MKTSHKILSLIVGLLFLGLFNASARQVVQTDSAHMLIDTAIRFAKKYSLYRNRVNWVETENAVLAAAKNAKTFKEAEPAMQLLFQLLGDHHGAMVYKKDWIKWQAPETPIDTTIHSVLLKKIKKQSPVKAQLLEKGYGYLLIPNNNPHMRGDNERIAQQLQDSLMKLNPEHLQGLVIDLRLNPGGSMMPVLGGIINLFGQGKLGTFIDPASKTEFAWGITGNRIYNNPDTVLILKQTGRPVPDLKIVVLIGPRTASSGEAVAISFKGRKNTRFIGEDTWGYTTANDSFQFGNDLSVFMATSVEADRNGNIYWDHVSPDEVIIGGDDFDNLQADQKVKAALKWLKAK